MADENLPDVTAGNGEPSFHRFPQGSGDDGPLLEDKHYLGIEAVTWFINERDSWLRSWIVSGMIDINIDVERYQVGLGTFELRGNATTAPIFDRPVLSERNYRGGPLTIKVSLFAIKHDTALATMLKGASRASLGIVQGMIETATPTGPQRVLGAAAGDLVASVAALEGSKVKVRNLFGRDGIELSLRPDQLGADTEYVLFHRGTQLDREKLDIDESARPVYDGAPLRDGAWVLLRVHRQTRYSRRRPWFELERGLGSDIDNLINDVGIGGTSVSEAVARLGTGTGDTLFDRFRALRLVIQQDGCLTLGEAKTRVSDLARQIEDARTRLGSMDGSRSVGRGARDDSDLRTELTAMDETSRSRRGDNHVLLIGVDAYESRALSGCVNDVLELGAVLREHYGVRQDEITLLASPRDGREVEGASPAEAANIRAALDRLASSAVTAEDRVVIHFSGHGGFQDIKGARWQHAIECILPVDYETEHGTIYDLELNRRLAAIARRTRNLTVVLDCCHSGGASRGPAVRSCPLPEIDVADLPEFESAAKEEHGVGRGAGGAPLVLAACLADQVAQEFDTADGRRMGKLTHALTVALRGLDPEDRDGCSWRELWPEVLAGVEGKQQPWLIGNGQRGIFGLGLAREPGELRVRPRADDYVVYAGTLLDITKGTRIGVYGSEPASLPHPNSADDDKARVGTLCVENTRRGRALARALEPFTWPKLARCRVVRHGKPALSLALEGDAKQVVALRGELAKLEGMVTEDSKAAVRIVEDSATGEWVLCDEEFGLATNDEIELVRFTTDVAAPVVSHCQRYRAPLRLASRCTDLHGALELRVLDASVPPDDVQRPDLPDLACDGELRYRVPLGTLFCVEVINRSQFTLYVTLLNVARDGQVEYLGDAAIAGNSIHVFWRPKEDGAPELGVPFELNGTPGFDRFVAIGTTREQDAWLGHLSMGTSFEAVIRTAKSPTLEDGDKNAGPGGRRDTPPPTYWTATQATIEGFNQPEWD